MTTKTILWVLFWSVLFGLLTAYIVSPTQVDGSVAYKPSLSHAQVIWIAQLMNCESDVTATAVNPNDLDNTPSWGILQFKPSTFESFAVKYGIGGELMSAESQVAIVTHWILNPSEVTWSQQFPACIRKIGEPPLE